MASNFTSERLKLWRGRELNENFTETLNKIEEFGWQTWTVGAEQLKRNFSYTVGVSDIFGLPELITVGLIPETGGHSLNRAVKLMRDGIDLTKGRFRDIVGEVEVEFQSIDPKWMHHVMLRTDWYYEGRDVPALQLIYPDLENRFQWEEGFNDFFRQPILATGYPEQQQERSFWLSNDRHSSLFRWKFADSPDRQVFVSRPVSTKEEDVTYVSHDAEDGAWLFMGEALANDDVPVLLRLHEVVDEDRSLEELADLPAGWCASREAPGKPWERFESEEDDDEEG